MALFHAGRQGRRIRLNSCRAAVYANTFPAEYIAYIGLEDSAAALHCWSPELIHGLLQTEEYARATMRSSFGSPPRVPPGEIQRRIDARLRRQQLLAQPGSKEFIFILDEAALRHRLGTVETMRAQLAQLEPLSRLPNVTIRVLPFSTAYPIGPCGFAILHFAPVHGTILNDVVYMEHLTGQSFLRAKRRRTSTDSPSSSCGGKLSTQTRPAILRFGRDEWATFIADVRAGELGPP